MAKLVLTNFVVGHEGKKGWVSGANCGFVGIAFDCRNETGKTIQSITFVFRPFDLNFHCQKCLLRGKYYDAPVQHLSAYLKPGEVLNMSENNLWFNDSIFNASLLYVNVSYSNGKDERIEPEDVEIIKKKQGCYVATAVYGSYDCPEVWTLRRYRDNTLASTWHGRVFIKTYYAISPTLVKWFGNTNWFKKMWRSKLDRMVNKLQENGVESTPYEDKNW